MKHLFHLNKYFRKYRLKLGAGIIFVILSNIAGIVAAQMIRKAMDTFGTNAGSEIFRTVTFFILWYIGLTMLKGVLMFFMRQTIIVMSRNVEFDLKNEIYEHYQLLGLSFYRKNHTGDLVARISEDVSRVRMYIGPAIMYTINLVILFILVISAMLRVNYEFTLLVLAPLPVLSVLIYKISDLINKRSEEVQTRLSVLSTLVQETFSGIRVIKSFTRENEVVEDFRRESEGYKKLNMDLVKVNALFAPTMLLLIGISTLLTLYIGGKMAIRGEVTYGNIAEFIIYINMLTWPVAAVGWVTSLVQRAAASQERINEFLKIRPDWEEKHFFPEQIRAEIDFRNVSFTYKDSGTTAIKDISFSLRPGKTLGIMGKTGSGKSTLANLLIRMYDPDSGMILFDGIPISELNTGKFRKNLAYVPQDVFLFSDTIKNNILFGVDASHDENQVREAARIADIDENIQGFPDKYETLIGERGITLSGGQKQRVSMARAIIKDAPLLILDDCLSAVDTQTEEKILRNLSRYMKNRTSVIISHRISSVKNADHIIVLDEGRITEEGNHEELLEKKGYYSLMYQKQMAEENLG